MSHNGNLSSGRMFPRQLYQQVQAIDAQWAQARLRNEPLTEIKQGKCQSETLPLLSPNDEFAGYEVFVWQLMGSEAAPQAYGSYVHQAYRDGLALHQGYSDSAHFTRAFRRWYGVPPKAVRARAQLPH